MFQAEIKVSTGAADISEARGPPSSSPIVADSRRLSLLSPTRRSWLGGLSPRELLSHQLHEAHPHARGGDYTGRDIQVMGKWGAYCHSTQDHSYAVIDVSEYR